jgi:outer membrane protein TolC
MAVEGKIFEARQAYWELAAAERALGAAGRAVEALKGMRSLSSGRAGFGQLDRMGQLMNTMLGMEAAEMEIMLPHWGQERTRAEARLNRLMGAPQGTELPKAAVSLEDLQAVRAAYVGELGRRVEKNNPELEEARHHLEHARSARTLARSAWLPDLMLQGAMEEDSSGMRENSFMAGITLPWVWFWGKAGKSGAANAEWEHSEVNLSAASLRLSEQAYVQQKELENSLEQLEIVVKKMIPLAEQGFKQAVSGFRSGSVGANEALMAVKAYWMAEERLSRLISGIGMSRAMLDMLMATHTSSKEMSHE